MLKKAQIFAKPQRILAAKLCFLVFFVKMLISATPIFSNVFDRDTIIQVVLQLEIENTTKSPNAGLEDLHEHGIKVFKHDVIDGFNFALLLEAQSKARQHIGNEKDIRSYDPAVPTPPPNC